MVIIENFPITGIKVSEQTDAASLTGSELIKVIQNSIDAKTTIQKITDLTKSQLGTSSIVDTGTIDGTVPLIGTGNKLNNSLLNSASDAVSGIAEIATDTEVFTKDSSKILTAQGLFNSPRDQAFSVSNSVTSINQSVSPGSNFNILTSFLQTNETKKGNITFQYKNTSNVLQTTILDETNNKLLFPSNIHTFGNTYVSYTIRITGTYDIDNTSGQSTKFNLALKRVIDNSDIAVIDFLRSDLPLETSISFYSTFLTFVNTETDPFVIDGCYIEISNDPLSSDAITLQNINMVIFRE